MIEIRDLKGCPPSSLIHPFNTLLLFNKSRIHTEFDMVLTYYILHLHCFLSSESRNPSNVLIIGLSEEMRIARLVLGQGYMPVAVTTSNTKNGCWSLGTDSIRIQEVLDCQLLTLPKDIYFLRG